MSFSHNFAISELDMGKFKTTVSGVILHAAIVSQPEKPHKTPEDATRLQSDVKAGDSPR